MDILVRPAELRQTSQSLRGQAQKVHQAIETVDVTMRALKGQKFLGNRATALQSRYESRREALLAIKSLILRFSNELDRAATTFEQADRGSSGHSQGAPRDNSPGVIISPVISPIDPTPSPDAIKKMQDALRDLNVTKNSRYQPGDGKTWCNIFTMDYCKKMGVPLPQFLDWNNDKKIDDHLDANEATRWLKGTYDKGGVKEGPDLGWKTISADEAAKLASSGKVVVAGWENLGGIGHMAVVRPESTPGDLRIAQAGAKNFENGSVRDGFGNRTPTYFVYDP
jgi:WXG100 family type VII secretion target